jgi:hypothetical protein
VPRTPAAERAVDFAAFAAVARLPLVPADPTYTGSGPFPIERCRYRPSAVTEFAGIVMQHDDVLGTQQAAALAIVGPIGIAFGLLLVLSAIFDPARWLTGLYEANEDSRSGNWASVSSSFGFRLYAGFVGLCSVAIGR